MQATENKIQENRNIYDDSFDQEYNHYKLYLQVSDSGIAACIVKPGENKIIALEDFKFNSQNKFSENFENIFSGSRMLSIKNFRSVNCCVLSGNSLLIPQQFYSRDLEKQYFHFNTSTHDDDTIFCDDLEMHGMKNIFTFSTECTSIIRKCFSSVSFCHHSSVLIKSVMSSLFNNNDKGAFIYLRENSFDIVISVNRKLIYCNTFSFQTCEDFLYYVLFCFEQTGLNNDTNPVTVAGEINSDFFSALNKYVPNISKAKRISGLIFPYVFQSLPETEYFTLFSQPLCE